MNGVRVVLVTVGLILVGTVAWWFVKLLFGAAFYLILGLLVVAGGWYLYTRARRGDAHRTRRP